MRPVFISLSYSPWSEKARWSLDRAGIDYKKRGYEPVIGEPALRWKLKKFRGTVSVPVLDLGTHCLSDSVEIARYASQQSPKAGLFPKGKEAEVEAYNTVSEDAMAGGRARSIQRVLDDPETQKGMVPRPLRKLLGPLATTVGKLGTAQVGKKYRNVTPEDTLAALKEGLDRLRADLDPTKEMPTLLDDFSYADIAMAQMLMFVAPTDQTYVRMSRAARSSFQEPTLAEEYADLVEWRDKLYETYRHQPAMN